MKYNINIVSDIFNKASELFDGDDKKASEWLDTPNKDFNNMSPLQFCKPYDGAVKVEKYLNEKLEKKNGINK